MKKLIMIIGLVLITLPMYGQSDNFTVIKGYVSGKSNSVSEQYTLFNYNSGETDSYQKIGNTINTDNYNSNDNMYMFNHIENHSSNNNTTIIDTDDWIETNNIFNNRNTSNKNTTIINQDGSMDIYMKSFNNTTFKLEY